MSKPLTYQDAGVNIDTGNELVDEYKKVVSATHHPAVLNPLGGFCALYDLSQFNLKQPVLVSSTDGVGTKLRLALDWHNHSGVGIDLVAMCVNDLIVMGAKPLFFLDYFATGKLDKQITIEVVKSIAEGCQIAHISLVGGETAEMPGMYHGKDYDLAGFCVGVVEKTQIVTGEKVKPGDVLIALPSTGIHSNGYSLVRKIFELNPQLTNSEIEGESIKNILLSPTKIYTDAFSILIQNQWLLGAAHITGGGLTENIPRFLPENTAAYIDMHSWSLPPIFQWLQEQTHLDNTQMRRTFNCGVGMVVCVSKANAQAALTQLQKAGESPWVVGEIREKYSAQSVVFSDD